MMKKVLYIDDEINSEKMDSKIDIIQKEGIEIIKVDSIEKVMSVIESTINEIDIIVLDIIMPPLDYYSLEETNGGTTTGLRLLNDIRKKYQSIPIMIISIKRKNDLTEALNKYNIVKYLEKPIKAKDIALEIKKIFI